jgi:hypothetical protein
MFYNPKSCLVSLFTSGNPTSASRKIQNPKS